MAKITIKDLPDSIDLDRQAMAAITGGARSRGLPAFPASTIPRTNRVVDYPGGFAALPARDTKASATGGKAGK